MKKGLKILPGESFPLGATLYREGVNFCVFSKNCDAVELLLFDRNDHSTPSHVIKLDPFTNRTFYYWHAYIPGLKEGQLYGYRVFGPYDPQRGFRFDGGKVLVDPYTKAVVMDSYDRAAAIHTGDNCAQAIKSVVVGTQNYDWEGDHPLNHPFAKSFIYELHVGGFTRHPSSGLPEHLRGTYAGLIEKIPYLKQLGISAVELLPVQQFDPFDAPENKLNYWGYSPIVLFAPHHAYCTTNDPLTNIREFKDMVKALHKAGIEVILDVVFNHSAEGNHQGPTLSFKGFENKAYYMLDQQDKSIYKNYSGTGNTINANHSIARRMIQDCLRYWVSEMHIDGFRFDLAAVLSRDPNGNQLWEPPVLWEIESDPVLASTKIIAEAWDVGSYQLGSFVGDKWAEWNDRFRDDSRRFMKGDTGMARQVAHRIMGSPDLFVTKKRDPNRSINFITCHDGFTLCDLVSYNEKHNLANGEYNRDGASKNYSWNCGVEGPTDDRIIDKLRLQQIKNFFCLLLLSQGTPMLLMGDEVKRTQQGNNNAYCQDNEISWFDWSLVEKENGLLHFVTKLIQWSLQIDYFNEVRFWSLENLPEGTTITWHGVQLGKPDWSYHSHTLAFTLYNANYLYPVHVILNAYWELLTFELPPLPSENLRSWHLIIDTAADPPADIHDPSGAPTVEQYEYAVKPRSVVVLMGR